MLTSLTSARKVKPGYFNTWSSSALTSTCASIAATMCMTAPATPTHAGACNISIAFYSMSLRSHKLDSRIAGIFLYTLLDLQSNLSPPPLSLSVSLSVSLMQTHCLKDIGRLCHAGWTIPQHPQEGSVQPGQCPGVCGPVQPPSPVCLGR